MSLAVVPFAVAHTKEWDRFVAQSRNGTLFHTRTFLSYHAPEKFRDASLLFLEGESIRAILPAATLERDGNISLVSHPGASYGGLVLAGDTGIAETGAIVDAFLAHARSQQCVGIDLLRLTPPSVRRLPADDQEYWLYQRGGRVFRFEMDGSIDLNHWSEETILDQCTGKCRNMVRQAERSGMDVKVTNDFQTFWPILEATLASRHAAHPTHTLAEIQRLHALFPAGVRLLSAHLKGQMVGGIVVFTLNDRSLYTLYMAQDYAHQQIHPIHLLLTRLIALSLEERVKVLHLGVSTEDGGTKLNEGLTFFKESFGMRPVRRESWRIEL